MDCTHCQIKEPRALPEKEWFSHKLNRPGLSYEIALHLYKNKVAWINGPFRAGEADLAIFRKENGLKSKIPPNKLLVADRGYGNEPQISVPNDFDGDDVKAFKRCARARQENFNQRVKEFGILSQTFRSTPDLHGIAFDAVRVIVMFSMENGRPLSEL